MPPMPRTAGTTAAGHHLHDVGLQALRLLGRQTWRHALMLG